MILTHEHCDCLWIGTNVPEIGLWRDKSDYMMSFLSRGTSCLVWSRNKLPNKVWIYLFWRSLISQRPDVESYSRSGRRALFAAGGDENHAGGSENTGTYRKHVRSLSSILWICCSSLMNIVNVKTHIWTLFPTRSRLFGQMTGAWDGCQKYFYRSWARRNAMQAAMQAAVKVCTFLLPCFFSLSGNAIGANHEDVKASNELSVINFA